MEYSPLPPIIPISACGNPPPERGRVARGGGRIRPPRERSERPRTNASGATFFKLVIIQDENPVSCVLAAESFCDRAVADAGISGATISNMKVCIAACTLFLLCGLIPAQDKSADAKHDSVTVPAAIDHNRVVINADISLPNGSTERVS